MGIDSVACIQSLLGRFSVLLTPRRDCACIGMLYLYSLAFSLSLVLPLQLTVVCLEDLEGFRSAVLAAKRRLLTGGAGLPVATPYTGAEKSVQLVASGPEALMARAAATVPSAVASASGGAGIAGSDSAEVVAALHRIERTLQEGVALMAARPAGGMTMGSHAGGR